MRLAKIEHIRCGEYDTSTYLMVPDDLTEDMLQDAAHRAHEKYLDILTRWRSRQPVARPSSVIDIETTSYPLDMTLSEIIAENKEKLQAWADWTKAKGEALKGFDTLLIEEIPGSEYFFASMSALHARIDWGHLHGVDLNYGEGKMPPDFPSPARLVERE